MESNLPLLNPTKDAQITLSRASRHVLQQMQSGLIKTKQEAATAFTDTVFATKNITDLVTETLHINLPLLLEQLTLLKEYFMIKKIIQARLAPFMSLLGEQLTQFAHHAQQASKDLTAMENTLTNLQFKDAVMAKLSSEKKLMRKKEDLEAQIAAINEDHKKQQLRQELALVEEQIAFDRFMRVHNITMIYPILTQAAHQIDLRPLADTIEELFINALTAAFDAIRALPTSTGIVGTIIVSDEVQTHLQMITDNIKSITKLVRQALLAKPFITAPSMNVVARVKAMVKSVARLAVLKRIALQAGTMASTGLTVIGPVQNMERAVTTLTTVITKFTTIVQQTFVQMITQDPFTTIERAPVVLANALIVALFNVKMALSNTIAQSMFFLRASTNIMPNAYMLADDVNNFFGYITGTHFINKDFMEPFSAIFAHTFPSIKKEIRALLVTLKQEQSLQFTSSTVPSTPYTTKR